ncbi:hypothetical protein VTO42DRAFT_2528 [Malbranchea cinnamomea]
MCAAWRGRPPQRGKSASADPTQGLERQFGGTWNRGTVPATGGSRGNLLAGTSGPPLPPPPATTHDVHTVRLGAFPPTQPRQRRILGWSRPDFPRSSRHKRNVDEQRRRTAQPPGTDDDSHHKDEEREWDQEEATRKSSRARSRSHGLEICRVSRILRRETPASVGRPVVSV